MTNNGTKIREPLASGAESEADTTVSDLEMERAETRESAPSDSSGAEPEKVKDDEKRSRRDVSVSLSLRGLIVGAVIVALVAATAVFGWLYFGVREQVDAQAAKAANDARAEKISLDYAVNAATMDYKDLQAWHVRLVAGTSPELNKKLSDAGASMEQVLVPLQWSSTAKPLVAKVRSDANGVYVVDSFVSVQTKTVQSPEALQSTATYSVTIDSHHDWQITDVGGIGAAAGPR